MARVTIWGDFKANETDHLNLSGELQHLINQSDINVINFEAPVYSSGKAINKSGPNISQSVEASQWLEERGFNVISLANNHVMDFGNAGLEATINSFHTACVIGAGDWNTVYNIHVVEADGIKVGVLVGTHSEFGVLREKTNGEEKGCAWCRHPEFDSLIFNAKKICDYLIVFNHGGLEYMDYPLPEWREVYKKWIDMGADAVVASHPHVPQGWEFYMNKPILYSLGNFCFQWDKETKPHWNQSLCCILDIKEDGFSVEVKPISYDSSKMFIDIDASSDYAEHLNKINAVLKNDNEYRKEVNRSVLNLLPGYYGLFSRSGFFYLSKSLGIAKGVVEGFRKEHIYNCIKCESHRWAIERAMRLKYNMD